MVQKWLRMASIALGLLLLAAPAAVAANGEIDTWPPTIVSTSPANGATGVPLDTTIIVTWDEQVWFGGDEDEALVDIDVGPDRFGYSAWFDGTRTILTIQPGQNAAGQTIPAGALVRVTVRGFPDLAGNIQVPNPYVFSFTMAGANQPPVAGFTANPTDGLAPLTVAFDAAASSDAEGAIASFAWDWGDESPSGSGVTATHVYTAAGTYTVTLTVTDSDGATDAETATIHVLTPTEATSNLILKVEGYNLRATIETGLTDKLDIVIMALDAGKEKMAINNLNAFIKLVKAQKGKALTAVQVDDLIADAQDIIASL